MKNGGHGEANIKYLDEIGRKYKIEFTFKNGVRVGAVANHDLKMKKIIDGVKNIGQSWFPKSWGANKIKSAGQFVIHNNF